MKDIYEMSSIREREMLKHFQNLQSDFTIQAMSPVDGYDKWDAVIMSAGTRMLLEIKVRDWNSWEQEGWFLEEKKYNALKYIQAKQLHKNNIYLKKVYMNIFKDGIAMFDLDNVQIDFVERYSKKSVMAQDGMMKPKMMAKLPIESATFYPYKMHFNHFNYTAETIYKNMNPGKESYSSFFINQNSQDGR